MWQAACSIHAEGTSFFCANSPTEGGGSLRRSTVQVRILLGAPFTLLALRGCSPWLGSAKAGDSSSVNRYAGLDQHIVELGAQRRHIERLHDVAADAGVLGGDHMLDLRLRRDDDER